ncbi:MAG: hypothetical protein K0Q73_5966 [Paenibacillus sp.]|jgi:hypothetical protein|nr:hypothetical protein [Paenibacillus sp.]
MRPVVIEMQKGKPVVVSCPKKVQVIFREPKKRTMKKRIKTFVYQVKSLFGAL